MKAQLLQSESTMTMVSLQPIKGGNQIFNDFGQLPRSDLLRRYGYVTDRYRKWDVVEIDLESVTTAVAEYARLSNAEIERRVPTQRMYTRGMKSLIYYSFSSLLIGLFCRTRMTLVGQTKLKDLTLMMIYF